MTISQKPELRFGNIDHSVSVGRLLNEFGPDQEISSWDLVRGIFKLHPEYADGLGKKLKEEPGPENLPYKPASDWIGAVSTAAESSERSMVDGRVLIVELAGIDQALGNYLKTTNALPALQREVGHNPGPREQAVVQEDAASDVDDLGRQPFADALARYLTTLWKQMADEAKKASRRRHQASFSLLLHGAWGSGKSTLLRLLGKSIKFRDEWVIIEFNAWRNQHIEPVWWPLLDRVMRGTESAHPLIADRVRALPRRLLRVSHAHQWWAVFITAIAIVIFFIGIGFDQQPVHNGDAKVPWLKIFGEGFKWVGGIFSVVGTLWSVALSITSTIKPGTAKAAALFEKLVPDPLETIRFTFSELLSIVDQPVMIFIDDLDRCQQAYVVELLESVQTLFSDRRAFYVVAADKRWIAQCYESAYTEVGGRVSEPGRPIGDLFLEKIFQLSTSVPAIPDDLKERFVDVVTTPGHRGMAESLERAKPDAVAELAGVKTEEEIFDKLKPDPEDDVIKKHARIAAAIRMTASENLDVEREHRLKKFSRLMEANPRAIKLLATAYGIYLAHAMASGVEGMTPAKRDQMVLWTILNIRFPVLADYLESHPKAVSSIAEGKVPPGLKDKNLQELVTSPKVTNIVCGTGVRGEGQNWAGPLEAKVLAEFVGRTLNEGNRSLPSPFFML